MRKICVFCGSSPGHDPRYIHQARTLGRVLAENDLTLVFGASNIGLMGALAAAVMENSGYAIGVIPKRIYQMVSHRPLSEEHVVEDMHERKALMYNLADAFLVMPGGLGTMEEFFEAFTWNQLGYHLKPIGILEVNEFFAPLLAFLKHMAAEGFCRQEQLDTLAVEQDPACLIKRLQEQKLKPISKHDHGRGLPDKNQEPGEGR
ncbi:MAG: TIGR00730 family Rossman fold protein [Firmicutes bacterium]|nr:TIGR00730 family Rossman fold protein [Bacillota bacterium]